VGPGATDQLIREGRLLNLVESHGVPAPHYCHLMDLDDLEQAYRASITADSKPAPLVEFTLRWLHRNVPDHARPSLCKETRDPGNFCSTTAISPV
jgi:hypothetical protein